MGQDSPPGLLHPPLLPPAAAGRKEEARTPRAPAKGWRPLHSHQHASSSRSLASAITRSFPSLSALPPARVVFPIVQPPWTPHRPAKGRSSLEPRFLIYSGLDLV